MVQPITRRFIAFFSLLIIGLACTEVPYVRAESAVAVVDSGDAPESYPKKISIKEAATKKVNGAFILDVRELHEFVEGHIPGAVMIPLSQLRNKLGELPKDKEIVVVCFSGGRSLRALELIRSAGYSKSSSMAGGMLEWTTKKYPTETGR
jgi:rhodanese-related sulfurtransferase